MCEQYPEDFKERTMWMYVFISLITSFWAYTPVLNLHKVPCMRVIVIWLCILCFRVYVSQKVSLNCPSMTQKDCCQKCRSIILNYMSSCTSLSDKYTSFSWSTPWAGDPALQNKSVNFFAYQMRSHPSCQLFLNKGSTMHTQASLLHHVTDCSWSGCISSRKVMTGHRSCGLW